MRRFLVILVLVGAAIGGWFWWKGRAPAATDDIFGPTSPATTRVDALPAAAQKAYDEAESLWAQAGPEPARAPSAPRMLKLYSQVLLAYYGLAGQHDAEEAVHRDRLKPLGDALFFAKGTWPSEWSAAGGPLAIHQVSAGENPDAIARSYGMSREFLNRLRGKEPNSADLRAGEIIKAVKLKEHGGFAVEIDLSDYTLDLYIAGLFARRYHITIGAPESPTPTGSTQLTDRVWHPQWTHPVSKKVFQYGDPENILGPVWLPFDAKLLGAAGIGIHGYTGSDGRMMAQQSNGCVRMENEQVQELYWTLSHPQRAPTAVTIRP